MAWLSRQALSAVHIGSDCTQDVLRFEMHVPRHFVFRLEAVEECGDSCDLEIHHVIDEALLLDLLALSLTNPSCQEENHAKRVAENECVQGSLHVLRTRPKIRLSDFSQL